MIYVIYWLHFIQYGTPHLQLLNTAQDSNIGSDVGPDNKKKRSDIRDKQNNRLKLQAKLNLKSTRENNSKRDTNDSKIVIMQVRKYRVTSSEVFFKTFFGSFDPNNIICNIKNK